jgi:serine/threonine protein kinase
VVRACANGETSIRVEHSVDIWAFGVIAFELLTQRRAFSTRLPEALIWEQIMGRIALPWEAMAVQEQTRAPEKNNHFRALAKGAILECLHRAPSQRPTAKALVAALRALLDIAPGSGHLIATGQT